MSEGRNLALRKWESKIDEKLRKQRQIADLSEAVGTAIEIQIEQGKAFRDTIDNVESDFRKLEERVTKLEEKSQ